MPLYHIQNVLNGGEITPLMCGRVDQPRCGSRRRVFEPYGWRQQGYRSV